MVQQHKLVGTCERTNFVSPCDFAYLIDYIKSVAVLGCLVVARLERTQSPPPTAAASNMPRTILYIRGFHANTRARDLAYEFER